METVGRNDGVSGRHELRLRIDWTYSPRIYFALQLVPPGLTLLLSSDRYQGYVRYPIFA
jgi:hypothetical protein